MIKNYRVVRSTYKKKHSFTVMSVSEDSVRDGFYEMGEYYVEGDSLDDLKSTLGKMLCALDKPTMEEKRELVEI